uniref:Uncharacterized protein n=1 Tax=Arundo donax TaxID=35708 RepID=A0A0A9GR62_ARUDO
MEFSLPRKRSTAFMRALCCI